MKLTKVEGHRRMEQEASMTKQNPFDAAIVLLREFLGVRTLNGVPFDGASLVAALNVLEAAGKINKQEARNWYFSSVEENDGGIYVFLAALPDEVKP